MLDKKSLYTLAVTALVITATVATVAYAPVMRNRSDCLQPGIYHTAPPALPLQRGGLVSFCPPMDNPVIAFGYSRGWLLTSPDSKCAGGVLPYMKQVGAVAGDTVTISAGGVTVNGSPILGSQVQRKTLGGADMPHMAFGTIVVPKGEFFALATYSKWAFDSRYYGLVSTKLVAHALTPLILY